MADVDTKTCVVLVPFSAAIDAHCESGLCELERRGYCVRRVRGYASIDTARSQLATDALDDGFDEIMWIDADVGFEPNDVTKLRYHKLPLVCGIYVKKGQRALSCHLLDGTQAVTFGTKGGLTAIRYAATGFLHTRRELYETIRRDLQLPTCNTQFGRPLVPYFQPMVVEEGGSSWYLGEDFAFCERATRAGFKVMADTTIRLWHYGLYGYSWEDAGQDGTRYETYHYRVANRR